MAEKKRVSTRKYSYQQRRWANGTINRLPSGSYRARAMVDGKRIYIGTFPTEDDAEDALKAWRSDGLTAVERKRLTPRTVDPDDPVVLTRLDLNTWFEEWQVTKAKRQAARRRGGAPKSLQANRDIWARWSPHVGKLLPHQVTLEKMQQVVDVLKDGGTLSPKTGKPYGPLARKTLQTHVIMVCALVNYIVKEEKLARNPLAGWSIEVDPVLDAKRPVVVVDPPMLEELEREFTAAGHINSLIWHLLLKTGCRRSELAGFTRSSVDLRPSGGFLRVTHPLNEINGRLVPGETTKGGKAVEIPLGPVLESVLRERLRQIPDDPDTPLVTSPTPWLDEHRTRMAEAVRMRAQGMTLQEAADKLAYAGPSCVNKAVRNFNRLNPRKPYNLSWNNYDDRVWKPIVASAARRRVWALYRQLREDYDYDRAEARREAAKQYEYLCGFTPHHVRHLACALMIVAGLTDEQIAFCLNHANPETSRKLYGSLLPGVGKTLMARAEEAEKLYRAGRLQEIGLLPK